MIEPNSEVEIIQKILKGEHALFEILIRRFNPYLYKIGRSYGFKHQDVEDLMQETFISAYLNLSGFQNRSSFKTWIIRIMLNHCYQKQQKFSFKNEIMCGETIDERSVPQFSSNRNSDTVREVVNRELNHVIEKAIEKIPEGYRMVFTLRELTGLNVAETAQTLNISETNVKARLSRAKIMLRREIEKNYSVEDIFDFNLIYCDKIVDRVMKQVGR